MKAFADNLLYVVDVMELAFDKVENTEKVEKEEMPITSIFSEKTLKQRTFENFVENRENAGDQHFLLFPQCILPFPHQSFIFHSYLLCHLQMLSI